ncbi:hypothetical protein [Nocardia flavorosea]|uniref:Uncharacterized protein n=1 Tax=Nocardia flavorosea TaxID=53429 RepID=A0A846YLX1_9NOCA|nr:hypothetical protein [Nocardia flavorosea]NKY59823.1 hypothetical protein [Nocardia flavorosea]
MTNYIWFDENNEKHSESEPPSSGYYYEVDDDYNFTLYQAGEGDATRVEDYETFNLFDPDDQNPRMLTNDGRAFDARYQWDIKDNIYDGNDRDGKVDTWAEVEAAAEEAGYDDPGRAVEGTHIQVDESKPDYRESRERGGAGANELLPGERLTTDESQGISSLTSLENGYTLSLDEHDRLILRDSEGNELWGVSGAKVAEYLSDGENYITVRDDGSIVILDADGELVKTIREKDDSAHAELVLLYLPEYQDKEETLHPMIDFTQDVLQYQVDCFARGDADLAEDVREWLKNENLFEEGNVSEFVDQYEAHLNDESAIKDKFWRHDERIEEIAIDTDAVNTESLNKIMEKIEDLDDELRAIGEEHLTTEETVVQPGVAGETQVIENQYLKRSVVEALFGSMEETISEVMTLVLDAVDKNTENEEETDNNSTDYQSAYDDGYQAGLAAAGQNTDTGTGTNTDTGTGNELDDAVTDFSDTYEDLLGPEDSGSGETGAEGSETDEGPRSPIEQLLQPIREAIMSGSGSGGGGAAQQAAGGGDMMSMMMPMMMMSMMSQMMQQSMQKRQEDAERAEREREREREDRDRERDDAPQSAQAPGPAAAPPTAAPAPGTAEAPAPQDAPPPAASMTQKSMVDMKLPNGTSQRVSSVVADAVNRELNNPNGSDARAAYQGTPGEASAGSPWVSVESASVATGDVAQWDNRSALVVVGDAGLQVIVNGELVPLDPHNPPDGGQGGYGGFRGFFHPSGADVNEVNDMATAGAASPPPVATTQQTAPAAPPAVTPPATMEVR